MLCMLATEPVEQMADVPLITAEYPAFSDYLPWGPFYGVFVKQGTDASVVETLSAAFVEAFNDPSYQDVLKNYNVNPIGYAGTGCEGLPPELENQYSRSSDEGGSCYSVNLNVADGAPCCRKNRRQAAPVLSYSNKEAYLCHIQRKIQILRRKKSRFGPVKKDLLFSGFYLAAISSISL